MRAFTFIGIAAAIAAPAAVLGAVMTPEVKVRQPPPPAVTTAPQPIDQIHPVSEPAYAPPATVQDSAPAPAWMVASTRGCVWLKPLGYETPQDFIAHAQNEGMALQVLYSDPQIMALTDATNNRAPVVFFARGRDACERIMEMGADLLPLY